LLYLQENTEGVYKCTPVNTMGLGDTVTHNISVIGENLILVVFIKMAQTCVK